VRGRGFSSEVLVARYLVTRRAQGKRPATLQLDAIRLGAFVHFLAERGVKDLYAVGPEELSAYQRHLGASPLAPRTRYDALAAVCRFFRFLVASRLLLVDPSVHLELGHRRPFRPVNVLSEAEVERLLAAADVTAPIGLRDRALLELLYSSGLRRAEVCALDVTDVDLTEGLVFVRSGKGGKDRLVPLGETAAEALRGYLRTARPRFVRCPGNPALFLAAEGCGTTGNRLSAAALKERVALLGEKAGLARRVTPHTLRHSLATHLLRAGAGLRHVQAILGHSRIDTTEAYTHLDVHDLARAHARSHPRGRGL